MIRGIAIGLLLAAVSPVAAQPAGAQAESLFRQAKELMAQKKFAEACQAFAASEKLDPAISTMLNEADCREKNAQIATAWGLFVEVERKTRDDAAKAQLHGVAVARAKKLEGRLSTIAINVATPTPGLAITRNAEAVDAAAWNQKLPIDGGTYAIAASAPGHKSFTTTVTIGSESDAKSVDIPALPAEVKGEPIGATPVKPGPEPQPEPSHPSRGRLPVVLAISGGVLGAGAIGLELLARNTYSKALAETTDARRISLWQTANHERYADEALAVAGVACVGVAIWLFVRGGHHDETAVALAPTANGFVLDGRF